MIILYILINFINDNIIKIIGNIHNNVRSFLDFPMTVLNELFGIKKVYSFLILIPSLQ